MSKNEASKNLFENDVIAANIANLYLKPRSADVYFVFKSENKNAPERVPAHKVVLAATSNVFDTMFYGEMKMTDEIAISDASASAYKEFLQFFYSNKVELTEENVFEVVDLGNRYNVPNCSEICFQFLKVVLTNESICDGLQLALLYDRADLLRFCRSRIAVHATDIFKTNRFLECDKSILAYILKMQVLLCSESELFRACMSWVKAQSRTDVVTREAFQTHLGDLIREIRFASMTVEEFIDLYNSCDSVLTPDEYIDITQMITVGKTPSNTNINRLPRQLEWNSDAAISCTRSNPTDAQFRNRMRYIERVRFFQTGEEVFLLGSFVCAKICDFRNMQSDEIIEKPFDIVITEAFASKHACPDLENEVRVELKVSLTSHSETVVSLPQPLLIQPHHLYDIALVLKNRPAGSLDDDSEIGFYCSRQQPKLRVGPDIALSFIDVFKDRAGYTPITKFEFNYV